MEQMSVKIRDLEEKEEKYGTDLQELTKKVSVLQKERQQLDGLVQDCCKELEENKSEKVKLKLRYITILVINVIFISEWCT